MMKRMRALDVPKFRRTIKNRPRLGESVSLRMFLSKILSFGSTLVYIKLFLIWLSCVALDIVIGFRFELLWPLWLMVRHLYDANRVQTFASSFHYSAFSVFFVCITATSDLICYLFIPVQVLLFLASTYVWIQFVYQSTDRGFCASSLLLWSAFVGFEYLIRSRLDHSTLYLTRGSWITAGMFSNGAESIQIGTSSPERLEVYRPFAAHCLGYPIVTLGFRVKSFFSSWRLKRRRRDVQHHNELFQRLLADAVPIPLECRYHHLSSAKQQLALEHDQAEYELDEEESPLNGNNIQTVGTSVVTNQPTAFCYLNGPASTLAAGQNGLVLHHNNHVIQQRKNIRVPSTNGKSQPKQNGTTNKKKNSREVNSDSLNSMGDDSNDDSDKRRSSITLFVIPLLFYRYLSMIFMFVFTYLALPALDFVCTAGQTHSKVDEERKSEAICDSWSSEMEVDRAEDLDDSDKEFQHRDSKRIKSKRRGRTPNDPSVQSSPSATPPKAKPDVIEESLNSSTNSFMPFTCIASPLNKFNGGFEIVEGRYEEKADRYAEELGRLRMELKESTRKIEQLSRDKETMEKAMDGVRSDLLQLRSSETSLKAEISLSQAQEKSQKREIQSIKCKLLETEQKLDFTSRQAEGFRLQIQTHQQKLKKDKANFNAEKAAVVDYQKEIVDLKTMLVSKDKEVKELLNEGKIRQNQIIKLEQKIRLVENTKIEKDGEKNELRNSHKQMSEMKQVIARLEKTLMSENRLKVDLFRALNDSKTQIETLTNQLRSMEIERIQNGFAPSLKADFMNGQLPSSLVASLAKKGCEDGSTNSSSSPAISPVSSSPIIAQSMAKPTNGSTVVSNDANDLEKILRAGGYSLFQDPAFSAPSTPSNVPRSSNAQSSRCNSPSASELFSILNGTGPINLAGYGISQASSQASNLLNGTKNISPTFH